MSGDLLQISGIVPQLASVARMGPPRSECGIGALIPFADRLWMISYASSNRGSGLGMGLYEIDEDLKMVRRPESVAGTYTNRHIHHPTNQLIIGPHVIDERRNVRTIEPLMDYRLTAIMRHLHDPERKVYVLGMEGHLLELDMTSFAVTQLADLNRELSMPPRPQPHFKAGHTSHGRVIVANNSYDASCFDGAPCPGRLAEWDGRTWTIIDEQPYNEVFGLTLGGLTFATGWDRASAILQVRGEAGWRRYRLPKASQTFDHYWATEWPRIRAIEHERLLMDCHGMFYELPIHAYGGNLWGVRPISTHLWVVPDFCNWRGLLFVGSDQDTTGGGNVLCAQPNSGIFVGKTDDLWQFGKPAGWGGPWWQSSVAAGEISDPYLMTGFEHKTLHIHNHGEQGVSIGVQIDAAGAGLWGDYKRLDVPAGGCACEVFPAGFSAHWVRLTCNGAAVVTAQLHYT